LVLFISLYASYLCKKNESMHLLINPPLLLKFQISCQMSICLTPFLQNKFNHRLGAGVAG
jgi:hypothetical protein